MRKLSAVILLCCIVFGMTACISVKGEGNTENSANGGVETTVASTETPSPEKAEFGEGYEAVSLYRNFEQAFRSATDVIVAKFIESHSFGENYIEYVFSVKERIHGNAPDTVSVYVMRKEGFPIRISDDNLILPLVRRPSVYETAEIYKSVCNTVVRLNDLKSSTMYNADIAGHITGIDISKVTAAEMTEYVKSLMANSKAAPRKLITATDTKGIVMAATDVVTVKVEELVRTVKGDFRNTEFYDCTVLETFKCEFAKDKKVLIIFFAGTVKPGDEVIVALDNYDNAKFYRLATKNSVFTADKKAEIADALT